MPLIPAKQIASLGILAIYQDRITTDVNTNNTNSAAPTTLLSRVVAKRSATSYLKISFTWTPRNDTAAAYNHAVIMVDGVAREYCSAISVLSNNAVGSAVQYLEAGLSAANHTITIGWFVSSGVGRINKATSPTFYSANMIIEEIEVYP